ncbi:metalloregulator ArsR/SmtB family transcription factor [uncultured Nocardioides sp.]|uniref:ArsR/SmtB family transcription factor n=1 Tax=uncultured Nocardioides sp. TaxID=198441 RepID=UPI002613E7A5|nr:metalloregulator ArsR/SmtB family transcription factor [uncultured Nocardioides sp.]
MPESPTLLDPSAGSTTVPCCPPLIATPLDADAAQRTASALKVLADPTRLRLLSLVAAEPGGEACACDLVEAVGLSQPTVSHHLRKLVDAGFLDREQRGVWAYYSVNGPAFADVARLLEVPAP